MEFSCERAVLQEAVLTASRAVSPKSTIQALEGLLIKAEQQVRICGYDLKTAIEYTFDAEISQQGAVVLNARILGDIIRKLDQDTVYFSCGEDNVVTIKAGRSEFNIIGFGAEDFPALPDVDRQSCIEIDGETLKNMISQTVFAVSADEAKPVHTGVKFEVDGDLIKMIAVDGFRLAVRTEKIKNTAGEHSFIVPGAALREVEHIISDNGTVMIYPDSSFILFDVGGVRLISRLLEGDFLNYQKAIPADMAGEYTADVGELLDSVERVSLVVSEKLKNPVRFVFESGKVKMSCITAIGRSYDECSLEGDAEPVEIGFNCRYIMEALRACPDANVKIYLKNNLSPCVMKPVEGQSFLYLVLPVRLKRESE